jgi:hypothetical protein
MRTTVAALVFACTVLLPPAAAQAESTPVRRTVERSAPAAAHVRVDGSVGDVQVIGDDGSAVRVTARIRAASDAAAAKVGVDVTRSGDESVVTVHVPQSSPAFVHWIFDRGQISVDLVVHAPRGSVLAVRSSVGDLDVRGISAAIDARTGTGDIHLRDVAADANATSGVGDVAVDLIGGWKGPRLKVRTGTGDARIHVSAGLRAHVEAHAGVGDLRNDIGNANVTSPVIDVHSGVGDVTIATR